MIPFASSQINSGQVLWIEFAQSCSSLPCVISTKMRFVRTSEGAILADKNTWFACHARHWSDKFAFRAIRLVAQTTLTSSVGGVVFTQLLFTFPSRSLPKNTAHKIHEATLCNDPTVESVTANFRARFFTAIGSPPSSSCHRFPWFSLTTKLFSPFHEFPKQNARGECMRGRCVRRCEHQELSRTLHCGHIAQHNSDFTRSSKCNFVQSLQKFRVINCRLHWDYRFYLK
jgi:hypothetical protein